jgi:hypothetical protein
MKKLETRRAPSGARPKLATKAAPGKQTRMDPALEHQAEHATARALRGEVDVARMLEPAPAAGLEMPSSPGQALPRDLCAAAEVAFGADLEAVRVHCDPVAASAAAREGARAFTAGRDIYFGETEWQPATTSGRGLIYHELAHVVQQTGRRDASGRIRSGERGGHGAAQTIARKGRSHG